MRAGDAPPAGAVDRECCWGSSNKADWMAEPEQIKTLSPHLEA